jgi:glutamyl/glutaminyl-tRNA synthetase
VVFAFDPEAALRHPLISEELSDPAARGVIAALAAELASAPRLDRETFREAAGRVKAATGQKGKQLFHPIRLALTGETDGPELDLLVPAIDRGAELGPASGVATVIGCRERAARFNAVLSGE